MCLKSYNRTKRTNKRIRKSIKVSEKSMSASQYELLKCDDCGKTLGYIYVSVKIYPPERWIRLVAGGPVKEIKKSAFCEGCFQRRKTGINR